MRLAQLTACKGVVSKRVARIGLLVLSVAVVITPAAAAQAASSKFTVVAAENFWGSIAAQLASLEQQGFLTAASSAVTTHLEYSSGRLTLNDHPFPPTAPVN